MQNSASARNKLNGRAVLPKSVVSAVKNKDDSSKTALSSAKSEDDPSKLDASAVKSEDDLLKPGEAPGKGTDDLPKPFVSGVVNKDVKKKKNDLFMPIVTATPKFEPKKQQTVKAPSKTLANGTPISKLPKAISLTSRQSSPARRLMETSSSTSIAYRKTEPGSDNRSIKQKAAFTFPRMNRLTQQRFSLNKAKETVTDPKLPKKPEIKPKSPKTVSSPQGDNIQLKPTQPSLINLTKVLEDAQSTFMHQVSTITVRGFESSYRFIALIQDKTCKLIVHKDDLTGIPEDLPAQSVGLLKSCTHELLNSVYKFFLNHMSKIQKAKDDYAASVVRKDLISKLQNEMDNTIMILDNEIEVLCSSDTSNLIDELKEAAATWTSKCSKMETELTEVQKNFTEQKKRLCDVKKNNTELARHLAERNMEISNLNIDFDNLRADLDQSYKVNSVLQLRLKESTSKVEKDQQTSEKNLQKISELEEQLKQSEAEKAISDRNCEILTDEVAKKDRLLAKLQRELDERKEFDEIPTDQTSSQELVLEEISKLKKELELKQAQMEKHCKAADKLRRDLEHKQDSFQKLQLKFTEMEKNYKQNDHLLALRTERINCLEREMKQMEEDYKRKLREVKATSSDKNTTITKMTTELASNNEQLQNLCSALSVKQTKLHSQEHVIKLLEESNARSVSLHTKLGEKNALLKEELEHLRRTVRTYIKILVGNGGKYIFEVVPEEEVPRRQL